MAEKRKKGSAVEFGDFDMDEATINRIKAERAESADRVARFNSTFVPTGSAFKDTSAFSGTSRDVKNMRQADLLLDKAADRGVVVRGQDIQLELGRGEIGVNRDKNRISEKGIDVTRELGLGELDVNREKNRIIEKAYDQHFKLGEGELQLNRDVFDQGVARYNKYGEPMDKLNVSQKAMKVKAIGDEFDYGESNALKSLRPEFLAGENGTFKPAKIYDENDIAFNYVPDEAQPEFDSSAAFPEYLRKKDWQSYSNPAIGALNEGAKSVMRGVDLGLQYLRPVEDVIMGMKPGASARAVARPAVRNKLRRRVIK